ncbi:MAG: TetR/AcrR family transcriptional regulator [Bacillota bacterium]
MDTRDKIIQSAIELFGEKGYHATSIQEISDKAEVSKGAVFHYFPNKSELLFVIHDNFIDIHLEQVERVLMKDDLCASEKMRELILDLVQLIADFKPSVIIFLQEFKYVTEDKLEIIKSKRGKSEEMFKKVIEQGVNSGEFKKDLDIDLTVKAIFGMCDWTYRWMNPNGRLTPREIGLNFWKILMGGLQVACRSY